MKRILIPIDFSENSKHAIKYGQELFKYEDAEFYLMHAYGDEIYREHYEGAQLENLIAKTDKEVKANLDKTLKEILNAGILTSHKYIVLASFNSLIDETEKIVKNKDIDLVIMGTKGISNAKNLTFGSNTLQVLRFIESPVLSVPGSTVVKEPQSILFLTDFAKPYMQRELELVCEFAHQFQSEIELFFVSKKRNLSNIQKKNKKLIDEVLCKTSLNLNITKSSDAKNTIVNHINSKAIDLLVLANTKHTSLDKIMLPSVIDSVSAKVGLPILALQNIREA